MAVQKNKNGSPSSSDMIDIGVFSPEKEQPLPFVGKIWPQVYAASAANCGAAALGTVLSWTATGLPDLRKSQSIGAISDSQEAWIGSIMTLGAVVSCPFVGFAIQRFGRRYTMLSLTTPFIIGWITIGFAQNLWMVLLGRFLTGFAAGGFSITIPVYITETADYKIRGCLASGFDMMLTVGILYIFLIGTYASWRVQAFICGLIPIVTHIMMMFVPESPQYLIERGLHADASRALCWLRGAKSSQQVEDELKLLTDAVDESKKTEITLAELISKPVLLPVSIGLALMFFQQASAIDGVMMYTVDIFHSAGSDIDENLSTNIVGAIQVVTTISAMIFVDRCGRRFLLLISALFMVLSLGTMGLFFHLKRLESAESLGWLPLASLLVYVVAFSIGFGPIPWLIMGEILPPRVKGPASGLVTITRWILGFGVTLVFKDLMKVLGEDGGYWLFSALCLVGLVYTFFFVPETKGKTLDEIQQNFNRNHHRKADEIEKELGNTSGTYPENQKSYQNPQIEIENCVYTSNV